MQVLLIEDNRADIFLVEEVVREHAIPAELQVVCDGETAMQFIESTQLDDSAIAPQLVLLDLNLPKRPGTEILAAMRRPGKFQNVPVIVVTSSDSAIDRKEAARLGATRYFRKPMQYERFLELGGLMKQLLGSDRSE